LQGVLEIHTSTNQIKQFKQGSILLVEDTFGKGHRTRNAGEEDLVLVWVGIEK
jgi:oxalate decarboxylase/phosphoglucose isomerase-like protein (cupin superfamily)